MPHILTLHKTKWRVRDRVLSIPEFLDQVWYRGETWTPGAQVAIVDGKCPTWKALANLFFLPIIPLKIVHKLTKKSFHFLQVHTKGRGFRLALSISPDPHVSIKDIYLMVVNLPPCRTASTASMCSRPCDPLSGFETLSAATPLRAQAPPRGPLGKGLLACPTSVSWRGTGKLTYIQ